MLVMNRVLVRGFRLCPSEISISGRSVRSKSTYKEDHIDGNTLQQFADRAQVEVKGGKGGNGCISHEVLSPGRKRPSGGSGGRGGNVFVVGDPELFSLKFNTYHFNGGHGRHGGSQAMTGRSGEDVYIRVPLGTIVSERFPDEAFSHLGADDVEQDDGESGSGGEDTDTENGWELLPEEDVMNATAGGQSNFLDGRSLPEPVHIDDARTVLLVARGGAAGIGNSAMMRSKMSSEGGAAQKLQSMPKTYLPGQHGDHRSLLLELKIIADVGLVGFPNAGKSSLLRALSNAQPKVASYRFTTLHPSVGVVEYSDCGRITVADIPGLIEGAHENKGLGHDFLRHIERTKVLLYVVDASASEKGRTPAQDLLALTQELGMYDETLLQKPALVFANKYDLDVSEKHRKSLDKLARSLGMEVLPGSALEGKGIPLLARKLREVLHDTVSVSARVGINEHDGDLPSLSADGEPAEVQDAPAPTESAEKEKESGGRRRRSVLPVRRKAASNSATAEE